MNVTTIGLDLAKDVFQVHGLDERAKPVLPKTVKRAEVAGFFSAIPVSYRDGGMWRCPFWARKLIQLGHTVRLMAPQFVKQYGKANKNDARDAEAIYEAVSRPTMRFVPIKTVEQQSLLALHRVPQGFALARTAHAKKACARGP